MLNFDVKRKINTLRDILVGKVPDPKAQVEQITIALIYKFMDDMDLEGMEFGGSREFFKEEYEKYAWTNIMQSENSGQQRANLFAEGIDKMSVNAHLPQLFRDIFRGAYVPYRDLETLNMFLKEINDFNYDHSEELGNAFEYLLSIMGSQGDAGQFRTPRHIIDMIVEIVDPQKTDSILDPACGTAGFLISSYKHILEKNKDKDGNSTLSADDRKRMTESFAGYDISPDMVRLSRVNMYLHKFAKPQISEYDTLSSLDNWDDTYDVILANPPFMTPKGGIIPHNRYRVPAKRAEVLFVDYIAEHLNPTGKAGIIVPEGIVFQSANAYKSLRKYLVEDNLLYAVISLPAGVFNPYSGVKTSILLLDKTLAKQKEEILFVKINNDGYDLGAQRRDVKGSDIPEVIKIVKDYQKGLDVTDNALVTVASKKDIAEQDYILVGERYKVAVIVDSDYPMVELGEIVEVLDSLRRPVTKSDRNSGIYPYYGATGILDYVDDFLFDEPLVLVGEDGAKWGANEKTAFMISGKTWVNNHAHVLRPIRDKVLDSYLIEVLNIMDLSSFITGVTVPKLNQQNLKQIKIPLPPIHIQEEIVNEIEGYQRIIDGAKQVVNNYKPTIKIDSSWEMVKLSDACKIISGYAFKSEDFIEQDTGVHSIKITNIGVHQFIESNSGYLPVEFKELYKRYSAYVGDIAIALTRPYISDGLKVCMVPESYNGALVNQRNAVLRVNSNNLIGEFLYYAMLSKEVYNYIVVKSRSLNQPNLSAKDLENMVIHVPDIKVQEKIVTQINEEITIVERNKRLIEVFEQKIKDKIAEVWGN